MRNHVIDAITEMAYDNNRIILITADLGFGVVEKFEQTFPDRFINVGIAEQNMAAVAAGMALENNMVFTYSIGNFPTLRCIEQIRNDVCYHNANVKILAVGGGFAYGDLGMTHHATEDIAMMRALPNMRVYVPSDAVEAVECLKDAVSFEGPAYIRMARGREENMHEENVLIDVKHMVPVEIESADADVAIFAAGTILSEGIKAREILAQKGISVSVFSMPLVKPIDKNGILDISRQVKLLVTMEEHNVIGGLGGAVSEILAENCGYTAPLLRLGLQDVYTSVVGSQAYLREYYGMSASKACNAIMTRLEARK